MAAKGIGIIVFVLALGLIGAGLGLFLGYLTKSGVCTTGCCQIAMMKDKSRDLSDPTKVCQLIDGTLLTCVGVGVVLLILGIALMIKS